MMAVDLVDDLDTWAQGLATALSIHVTRDPSTILPPCLYLEMPDTVGVTIGALSLTQPVWLVSGGGGKQAADELLGLLPDVLTALKATSASAQTLTVGKVDYHAYRIPTPLHIT